VCYGAGSASCDGRAQYPSYALLNHAVQRLIPKTFADRLLAMRGKVSHERRIVTILFCDVKGSTTMAEQLDPEEVMEIMNEVFPVLIEPVYKYEGTLARLMGDAVLAFFAFIGFEDIVNMAEEVDKPSTTLPRAILISLAITTGRAGLLTFKIRMSPV